MVELLLLSRPHNLKPQSTLCVACVITGFFTDQFYSAFTDPQFEWDKLTEDVFGPRDLEDDELTDIEPEVSQVVQ